MKTGAVSRASFWFSCADLTFYPLMPGYVLVL